MDADIAVSSLKEKLLNNSTIIYQYPMFEKQVQRAIKNLDVLEQRLKVAEHIEASSGHSLDDQRMARLLQAVYSVDDACDTLLITCARESFYVIKRKNCLEKIFQGPIITSLSKQILFTHEMKNLQHAFRDLSSYHHLLEMKGVISDIKDFACYNDNTRSIFQNHQGQQQRLGRISDFCLKEARDVVGLEKKIEGLINLKSITPNDDDRFSQMIAVVGAAGSGKKTLVRNVFNKLRMEGKFTKCAWIHVPSLFETRDILADMLRQIDETKLVVERTLSEEELLEELTEKLEGRGKYLIVIEDFGSHQVRKFL